MGWPLGDRVGRRIAKRAAAWRAEMEEPSSQAQVDAFEAWLKADPAHVRAYQQSDRIARGGARSSASARPATASSVTGARYRPAFALAATLVLALCLSWLVQEPSPAYAAVVNRGPSTRIVRLRDQSIVTLDTATTIEVANALNAHSVRLSAGRARFVVRLPAGRAIKVAALAGEISASAGTFDVLVANGHAEFYVISGKATVLVAAANAPLQSRPLRSGQGVRVYDEALTALSLDAANAAWPLGHVAFDDTPLSRIVAVANRAGQPPISVIGDAAGRLRVTGVLDLRDTRTLARKLAAALDLRIVETDKSLRLTR